MMPWADANAPPGVGLGAGKSLPDKEISQSFGAAGVF
jgi:hypothetical protein